MNVKITRSFKSAGQILEKGAVKSISFIKKRVSKLSEFMEEGAVPFKAVSVAGYSALSLFEIGWNIRKAIKIKGRYKAIPSLKVLASSGDLLGELGKGLLLAAAKAPQFLNALRSASTALGVASIVLQVFGLAANIWESVSIRKQMHKFNELKEEHPQQALGCLRSQLGDRKIFRIISNKQSRLIKTILRREQPYSRNIKHAVKVIDSHARSARTMQIVKTVVNILMILGLVLLLCAPTPLAPIFLGGMTIAMGISFATMIASSIKNRLCTRQLKKIVA